MDECLYGGDGGVLAGGDLAVALSLQGVPEERLALAVWQLAEGPISSAMRSRRASASAGSWEASAS